MKMPVLMLVLLWSLTIQFVPAVVGAQESSPPNTVTDKSKPIDDPQGTTPRVAESEVNHSGTFSSVLVKLQEDKSALSDLMSKMVSPRMTQIRESFRDNITEAEEILKEFRKDPTSRQLAARYEDKLSEALTELSNYLDEFAKGEDETLAALSRAVESGKSALAAAKAEAVELERQSQEFDQQANEFDVKLESLAKKFAPLLKSGQPLPVELDTEIQKAQTDVVIARQNASECRNAALEARRGAATIDAKLAALSKMRGKLEVAFHQANGQVVVIANVAKNRHNAILRKKLVDEITAATAELEEQQQDLDDLGEAFATILADLASAGVGSAVVADELEGGDEPQVGAEILQQYLGDGQAVDAADLETSLPRESSFAQEVIE